VLRQDLLSENRLHLKTKSEYRRNNLCSESRTSHRCTILNLLCNCGTLDCISTACARTEADPLTIDASNHTSMNMMAAYHTQALAGMVWHFPRARGFRQEEVCHYCGSLRSTALCLSLPYDKIWLTRSTGPLIRSSAHPFVPPTCTTESLSTCLGLLIWYQQYQEHQLSLLRL
jgi:hypothetical protein